MPQSYRVEIEQEDDGRFLAEVVDLPGVLAYGESAEVALAHVQDSRSACWRTASSTASGPPGP